MKVFSIDPGVSKCGWAIVEENKVLDYGIFSPAETDKSLSFNEKLNRELITSTIFFREKLEEVDAVAWEIVPSFGRMNQRDRVVGVATALKIATWHKGLPWIGLMPVEIKKTATGNAKATKEDIRRVAIQRFPSLPDNKKIPADVFDAIMIADVAARKARWRSERI